MEFPSTSHYGMLQYYSRVILNFERSNYCSELNHQTSGDQPSSVKESSTGRSTLILFAPNESTTLVTNVSEMGSEAILGQQEYPIIRFYGPLSATERDITKPG